MNPVVRVSLVTLLVAAYATGCAPRESEFNGQVIEPPEPAPELTGVNWDGEPFHLSDRRGKVSVVFFGFTYCPTICPMTLNKMKQLEQGLGEQAEDLEVVFVSVDPHRDTVKKLADYVPNFDPSFYGVRLTFDQLDKAMEDFDLTVQYGQPKEGPGTDSYYFVDHTGSYLVVDREGKLRLRYPPTTKPEDMRQDLEVLLES